MGIAVIVLLLSCFLTAMIHCVWDRVRTVETVQSIASIPTPRRRLTMQVGAVTCEVVAFEDFELIKTSEYDLDAAGLSA